MELLPPTDDALSEFVHQEPFRLARTLPLIATRFTPPRTPGVLQSRDRLLQRLDAALTSTLTLVCAPAGFGKTTLLAQWYQHRQQQGSTLAWLSIDEDDNTPFLFMRYLQAALRPLWQAANALPESAPGDDFRLFLAGLVNQLHSYPISLSLILDDYQNIAHPEIHDGLNWLLNHAPPSLHLIIASRSQPPLALSRLHMEDRLVEIDDRALRFNAEEARTYFATSISPAPDPQEIPRLIARTEGWVAGMKMAALASGSAHCCPTDGKLNTASRALSRYLEEVIFAPLPAGVLDFLLRTAILNRLHPSLCDAVTGKGNGEAMLAWIARHNLFLSALDADGFWFRYHPLMREALLYRLQHSAQVDIRVLHEQASNWFAGQQLWAEAIRHALAAGKTGAGHAEAGVQSLAEEGDIETMVRWIRYLPANLDPSRIELQTNLAWALAHRFRFHDARQLLDAIESLAVANRSAMAHSSWVKLRVVRAICEAFADNIAQSIAIVEPLLHEVPCGDIWVDGLVCNILSYCHLANARPQQALDVQQRVAGMRVANRNLFVEVYRAFVMAQGYLRQGNLAEAQRQAGRALQYAEQQTGPHSSSGATLAPILAEIAWEQGEVQHIPTLLTLRLEMIDDFCPPDGFSRCYIVLAKLAQRDGRTDEMTSLLLHAEGLAVQRGWLRAQAPLLAERIANALHAGDRAAADSLLRRLQGLSLGAEKNDVVSACLTLSQSRMLMADGQPLAAARQLDTLAAEQERGGEWLFAVRLRLIQAVALWRAGERERAITVGIPTLHRAFQQKLWRSLLDGGEEMASLLVATRQRGGHDEVFSDALTQHLARFNAAGILPTVSRRAPAQLRLTEREQQTLELIAEGYSNKEIARALGITAETVKWHLKQLYDKLQVNGRIQAVNQAREWQLFR
ncbi:LuxR C-terminal-related transcriptional regulator [Raoultella ornithinolytica]|uniref:LuxR C-terminal-related transcriptional regulator n=1 Tax=Raoultella ornithinolytica TaxID=54291 RepID=UPI002DBB1FF5|nr:LuxR C-terminal-related transcriptional regulator [Raoultella ornithinolytica]MEB6462974.1 LuxR C-terminal-related transcriptional regulator [Raoultella ornithinolytica]